MRKDPFLVVMKQVTEIGDELEKLYTIRGMEDDGPLWFRHLCMRINSCTSKMTILCGCNLTSLVTEESLCIGGRRAVDAIVVSAVILLSFVYLYLIGYINRGGSKAGSSDSLDFRDNYISMVLFQAACIWIKFRDVIPRGAVYHRRGSSKWEPRIKFPVKKGTGGTSKRIPLGSCGTLAEGEVAYRIAAFYCNKRQHTGRLDLGGGASFPIPAFNVHPDLSYEEKVKQIGDQVLKVYAEFEEQKASRNLPPRVTDLASEMSTGECELLTTSPIQQRQEPRNSRMDSAMQGQGSQTALNIRNGVDFNNPGFVFPVLLKTQHELVDACKQIDSLKAQVARTNYENMRWELKYLELKHEKGLSNHQIMQSPLQTQHEELELDPDIFFSMENGESSTR